MAKTWRGRAKVLPRDGAKGGALLGGVLAVSAALVAATLLAGAGEAAAATYKWVDEKGVVHYTDKMPPEALDKANVELNKQGIAVKKTDRALTPEQRRALEQDAEREKLSARQQEEIARRDRALLSSYTSEAEIDLARNRSLQTINNVVQSTLAYSDQLNKRRAEAETKKVELQGKPVVAALDREVESIDAELARQADLIVQKKRETASVIAKYDADKARWRELVSAKANTEPGKSASATASAPTKAASAAAPTTAAGPAKK
ncbi:MAG: DUF4124 domain-containing protein [Betaproteobacteria bacterium]